MKVGDTINTSKGPRTVMPTAEAMSAARQLNVNGLPDEHIANVIDHHFRDHGLLEKIIREIKEHDRLNPDHGIGCACHDTHAGALRCLFEREGLYDVQPSGFQASTKSLRNLLTVIGYVTRNP